MTELLFTQRVWAGMLARALAPNTPRQRSPRVWLSLPWFGSMTIRRLALGMGLLLRALVLLTARRRITVRMLVRFGWWCRSGWWGRRGGIASRARCV